MNQTRDHYSYRVYADPALARNFDADRFGGTIGELIKATQERVVFSTLPEVKGWKVIDVGAGTGRFCIPFLTAGAAEVAACDASKMLDVLSERPAIRGSRLTWWCPSPGFSRSLFRLRAELPDAAACDRLKKALGELCRVSNDRIVFDIPPRRLPEIRARVPWAAKHFQSQCQKYRTFPLKDVYEELIQRIPVETIDPGISFTGDLPQTEQHTVDAGRGTNVFALRLTRLFGSPTRFCAAHKMKLRSTG